MQRKLLSDTSHHNLGPAMNVKKPFQLVVSKGDDSDVDQELTKSDLEVIFFDQFTDSKTIEKKES